MKASEFVDELGLGEDGDLAPNDRDLQMVVEIEGEAHTITGLRFDYTGNALVVVAVETEGKGS